VAALSWLAGMAALSGVLAFRARLTRRMIAGAAGTEVFSVLLEQCASQLGVRRSVTLKLSTTAVTPAVCGLFRPVILLPAALVSRLSAAQMEAVLLHELAHVRRGDPWVNYGQALLQIFYFYNPLLWLANAAIRRTREEAVDELVLVVLADEAPLYPETLLQVAKFSMQTARPGFGWVGILEKKSTVGGRIRLMLHRPWPKSARLGIRGGIAVLALAAVLLPMSSRTQQPNRPPDAASSLRPASPPAGNQPTETLAAVQVMVPSASSTNGETLFLEVMEKHETEIARAWDTALTNTMRELQGLAQQHPPLSDLSPTSIANGAVSYLKNGRFVTNHVHNPQIQVNGDFIVPQLDMGGAYFDFEMNTHDDSLLPMAWNYSPLLILGEYAGFWYRYDFQLNPPEPALEKAVKDIVEKQVGVLRQNLMEIIQSDSVIARAVASGSVPASLGANDLCAAIYNRRWARALELIDSGVWVNGEDDQRRTPLGCLIDERSRSMVFQDESQWMEVLRNLLEHGADPFAPSATTGLKDDLRSPVEKVMRYPDATVLDMFLTNNASPARRTTSGETALHLTVKQGGTNIIDFLLSHGFSVNQTNNNGLTPLQEMAAPSFGGPLLPTANPPPYFAHRYGDLPGYGQTGTGKVIGDAVVADFLLSRGATIDVFSAAGFGFTNQLAALLRANPKLAYARDGFGRTPLHYAAPGRLDTMALLLKAGADPAALTTRPFPEVATPSSPDDPQHIVIADVPSFPAGSSPLHFACYGFREANVQMLLDAGAPVAQADADGNTPLHLAAPTTKTNIPNLLIRAGAPVDATNRAGRTPLRIALESVGGSANAALLRKAGAKEESQQSRKAPPSAGDDTRPMKGEDVCVVTIDADGGYWLEGKKLPLAQVEAELVRMSRENPSLSLEIRADNRTRFNPVAELLHVCESNHITLQISSPKQETVLSILERLSDINLYAYPVGNWIDTHGLPLNTNQDRDTIGAIMNNRRFRQVLTDLGGMDKSKASELVGGQLSNAIAQYLPLYTAQRSVMSNYYKVSDIGTNTTKPGLDFVIGTTNDQEVVILGARLKVLSLVWIAGLLELHDLKQQVGSVARLAIKQRDEMYAANSLDVLAREEMLYEASLYNRQILGYALLGVAEKSSARDAVLAKSKLNVKERVLASFDDRPTEHDLQVGSGAMAPDPAQGTVSVRYLSPATDATFDDLSRALMLLP